ncbi:MAG: hypothetical protein HC811_07180 [Flammeovirgaceae bacterium]|nr:hypothetical protein [Flammeovirgaceae bacterium]
MGSGAGTIGEADVITANFLFDFNGEVMTQALLVPNLAFGERVSFAMNRYMTSMKKELGFIPDINELKQVYFLKCKQHLGVEFYQGEFTDEEIHEMDIMEDRFNSDDWLFQVKKPKSEERLVKIHADRWIGLMNYSREERKIKVMTELGGNRVSFIKIESNINENGAIERLEKRLLNVELRSEVIRKIINDVRNIGNHDDWINAIMRVRTERQRITGYG